MRRVAHARNLTAAANTFHTTRWTLGQNGAGRTMEARYALGELFAIVFPGRDRDSRWRYDKEPSYE